MTGSNSEPLDSSMINFLNGSEDRNIYFISFNHDFILNGISIYFSYMYNFLQIYDFQNAFQIIHFSVTYYESEITELNGLVYIH